jgi:hypothetical protein
VNGTAQGNAMWVVIFSIALAAFVGLSAAAMMVGAEPG